MGDQLGLFGTTYRPREAPPVETVPLYGGRVLPCKGFGFGLGCGFIGPICARSVVSVCGGTVAPHDLCAACTAVLVRYLRAEGRHVPESYGWVV